MVPESARLTVGAFCYENARTASCAHEGPDRSIRRTVLGPRAPIVDDDYPTLLRFGVLLRGLARFDGLPAGKILVFPVMLCAGVLHQYLQKQKITGSP